MRHFLPKISTITPYYLKVNERYDDSTAKSPAKVGRGCDLGCERPHSRVGRCACPVVPPGCRDEKYHEGTINYL